MDSLQQNLAELTSSFTILWHNCTMRFVPTIFIPTDTLRASSNLTVAAEWKTTDTLSVKIFWSAWLSPNSLSDMSPHTGTNFFKASGRSFRSQSKICKIFRNHTYHFECNFLNTGRCKIGFALDKSSFVCEIYIQSSPSVSERPYSNVLLSFDVLKKERYEDS